MISDHDIYFISFTLLRILLEVWQPGFCGYAYQDVSIFKSMLFLIFILELEEFGWYACMWRCMAGGFNIWLVWRLLLILRHISCIWFCVSCVAFTPSLGRGQTFVNPTGHASFSVDHVHLFWNFISYFQRKSNGTKDGLFYLFIALLWNLFSLIHNVFLIKPFSNFN